MFNSLIFLIILWPKKLSIVLTLIGSKSSNFVLKQTTISPFIYSTKLLLLLFIVNDLSTSFVISLFSISFKFLSIFNLILFTIGLINNNIIIIAPTTSNFSFFIFFPSIFGYIYTKIIIIYVIIIDKKFRNITISKNLVILK